MGLAAVRQAAERHAGSVFARPRAGGGLVVGFTLARAIIVAVIVPASRRRGASAAGRTTGRFVAAVLPLALLVFAMAFWPRAESRSPRCPPLRRRAVPRGDALFLAEAPAFVPDDVDAELESMRIVRLYVPAATMSRSGAIAASSPAAHAAQAPAHPHGARRGRRRDGRRGARGRSGRGVGPRALEDSRARRKTGAGSRASTSTSGPRRSSRRTSPRRSPPSTRPSVCRSPSRFPRSRSRSAGSRSRAPRAKRSSWRSAGGRSSAARSSASFPRRSRASFRFRSALLVAFGGYGRTGDGTTFTGRMLPDGRIDQLSEDRALDFDFGQVFSSEPGRSARSSRAPERRARRSPRTEATRASSSPRWAKGCASWRPSAAGPLPNLRGRTFLVGGVPKDGYLVGYAAVRALLTGKPVEPRLVVEALPDEAGRGYTEFTIRTTNAGPTPTDLSHYNSWVEIRVEGGHGDFREAGRLRPVRAADVRGGGAQGRRARAARSSAGSSRTSSLPARRTSRGRSG